MSESITKMWGDEFARFLSKDLLLSQTRRVSQLRQTALDARPMREQRLRDRPQPSDAIRIGSNWKRS